MARRLTPFVRRLRALRAAAGISQYELAKRAGLTRQAVNHFERGNRHPTWESVQALAKGLGVSVTDFLEPSE